MDSPRGRERGRPRSGVLRAGGRLDGLRSLLPAPLHPRAQLFGPVVASLLAPFLVGFFFTISLTIFGGSSSSYFVETFDDTFALLRGVPFVAMESLRVTVPLAGVVAFLLRRSDPPEMIKRRNLATVDPYQHS